ncbi:MAG: hypothetical protein GY869_22550, partial [Planctomycetes bacterium]|nr:hypothetical protein [Planctomycetota bacterium]
MQYKKLLAALFTVFILALILNLAQAAPPEAYLVKDIYNTDDSGSYPGNIVEIGGAIFFTADDGVNGEELWKSDGSAAGTVMVKDIYSGSDGSDPRYLTNVNGSLFFSTDDGSNGRELWQSDGSAAGTVMVKDINSGGGGSSPPNLTNVNGSLFFMVDDGSHGYELWKSDGSAA